MDILTYSCGERLKVETVRFHEALGVSKSMSFEVTTSKSIHLSIGGSEKN